MFNSAESRPSLCPCDFQDDGTIDATGQSVSFVYSANGSYSVRLTVTPAGATGSVSVVRNGAVLVGFAPPANLDLALISPGTFTMGDAFDTAARPPHSVTLTRAFWIGKYEMTQARYTALMGTNPSNFQVATGYPQGAQLPVERVSWNQAMAYCAALNASETAAGRVPAGYQYRLPTEAEWEYACRAGTTTPYNTGSSLSASQAHIGIQGPGPTVVVGSFPANAWGLHETHGNVAEWCMDEWALYPGGSRVDPFVTVGSGKVFRGGGMFDSTIAARSGYRSSRFQTPTYTNLTTGFRVVLGPVLNP
jgi:formylglycine-generating enzyme required for sulfatase activity